MTARQPTLAEARGPRDSRTRRWPVIVLTYACAGAVWLRRVLSGSVGLACTTGTGVLPLCEQAATTWRQIENRDGRLSPVALSSIRAISDTMITVILADAGKSRWCEIAFSPPAAAEVFLQLYPGTKFICLHRGCPDVIREGVAANPWGLADTSFAPQAIGFPSNSVAAIAAYWAERTEHLLRFEAAHPAACRRVRYENLTGHPGQEAKDVFAFLDLTCDDAAVSAMVPEDMTQNRHVGSLAAAPLPVGYLPPRLTELVNDLQTRLGYPPIA